MGKFFKGAGLVALLVVILGFFYFQSSRVFAGGIGIKQTSQSSIRKAAVEVQDQEPEGNQHCENKDHPSNGKTPDPDKVACTCQPKCVNGKRQEDSACKRYCKPDTCDCPDPCPKT